MALVRSGRQAVGYTLTETMRYTICPPGRLPLANRRFSLVDVPDLQLLPDLWPGVGSVWIGAGPVPEVLHRALNGLAWLVRLRLLPSLSRFAPLFHRAINVLHWGEHRGGMFVAVAGTAENGRRIERSWHLVAEGDDGPFIPATGVAAIIRRTLDRRRPAAGARPGVGDVDLADYEALFAARRIHTGRRDASPHGEPAPLYRQVLGEAWGRLPEPLRAMHGFTGRQIASGSASVERGTGMLARFIAAMVGFPQAGNDVPVTVSFSARGGGEIWRRTFAGQSFASIQTEGWGRSAGLILERFGPFAFGLALVLDGERLHLIVRRWTAFGLPLPVVFAPGGEVYECVEAGRFRFHVEIAHPLTGLIVRYRGWLVPQADPVSASPAPAL